MDRAAQALAGFRIASGDCKTIDGILLSTRHPLAPQAGLALVIQLEAILMQPPLRRGFFAALVSAGLLASLLPAVTSAVVVGPAAQLAFTTQPTTTAQGSTISPVSVSIEDANGLLVATSTASVTIAIGTNAGGGTLAGTLNVAAIGGVATFSNLSIDNAGVGYTLTAASGVLSGATSTAFTIVGPATHLVFTTQPSTTSANAVIAPAVTVAVEDANNQVVTTGAASTAMVGVAILANPGTGTLSGVASVAAINGVATFSTLSINNAGVGYTLVATSAGLAGATSATFTIVGPATHLVFGTQPSATSAGAVIAPAVTVAVEDANNQVVTTGAASTTTVGLAIGTNPSSGSLSGTVSVAAVGGVATFSNLSINNAGVGYTLAASSSGLTGATSAAFTIVGPATHLVFGTQPSNVAANSVISPPVTVKVEDVNGQIVSTSTATIAIAIGTNPGLGSLSGTLSVAAVNGVATFNNLSINNAGVGYTLAASSSGLTGATSNPFTIGVSQHLAFAVQPGGGAAGVTWSQQPVVDVLNSLNQVVTSDNTTVVSLSIATNPAGGTLYCTSGTSVTVVNGVASFYGCSINIASPSYYTLTATSSPAWTPTTSAAFLIGGATTAVSIPSDTAVGQTQSASSFSHATKIVAVGSWITVRFQTSPAMAGRTLGVWIARKVNGVWSAFSPHTSIVTGSDGVAYYQYQAGSKVWESFLVKFLGDSTYAPSSSSGTQARWLY